MEKSPRYDGKQYVCHVKICKEKNWTADDNIFCVAYEGGDGLSLTKLKKLCEISNRFCFLSKQAYIKDDGSCTRAEISSVLEDFPVIGKPKLVCVEEPVTFYSVARLAYEKGICTNPAGLVKLNEIGMIGDALNAGSGSSSMVGPINSVKVMVDNTMLVAKEHTSTVCECN